jgi:thermosome
LFYFEKIHVHCLLLNLTKILTSLIKKFFINFLIFYTKNSKEVRKMERQNLQPIYLLSPEAQRSIGRDAQRLNILAAKLVAETVRTTLGPKGMDKMLVDSMGDVVVTNDGVTILETMEIQHPVAKMIVEVAKTQENEVGDGTTTAVVIAGELLKNAEKLLDQDIHPTIITKGFQKAFEKSLEILNEIAHEVSLKDEETLKKIAKTAITGKAPEVAKEKLADIIVKAVKHVAEEENGKYKVDLDSIKIEKKVGGSVEDSELIEGVVLDKEVVHPQMPKKVENAKILLLNTPIEVKETEIDAKIQITDPSQIEAFLKQEEKILKEMVEKIKKSGANVVITQKGIDDLAQHFLAKEGIMAIRRVKKSDMEKLAKATGAKILNSLEDIKEEDLGYAGVVEEKKIGNETMIFVKECKNPKAVTILIRGGTEHVVDETERAVKDALGDVAAALKDGKIVAGGGAVETELSLRLKDYAEKLKGKEQLAVQAYAEALEVIPRTLAENSGLDAIEILAELKAEHEKGNKDYGVEVFEGKIKNMLEVGVVEPLRVKTQALKSATEVSNMILRIDDIIAASKVDKGGEEPNFDSEE